MPLTSGIRSCSCFGGRYTQGSPVYCLLGILCMNFNVAVAACVAVLVGASSKGSADTLTVCSGGGCDYSDIQQAVNAAGSGDVISIAAGSYFPSAQIDTLGKSITLRGATNPDTGVATTFINGQTVRRLFICQNNEGASTVFENLIIELGNATLGGGMFIQAGCHPTLVNCAFVTNWAGAAGGAVYCAILTSPTFIDCAFVNNAAYELGGGAVYSTATAGYPSAPRFVGCDFINNEAILGYGGGMLVSASHPELIDCAFEWNLAGVSGGGLATGDGGETTLEASMVCNNMPNQIYGAWDDDGDNCVNEETCDADDDGTSDCLDECPDDPDKTEPGQCGCGTPDTDSDGDGTADCDDNCPEDPKKTEPGECGCGVSDGDSDGDGTVDCDDLCPFWPGDCSEDGMTIYVEPGQAIDVAVNAVPAGGVVEIEAGVYFLDSIINPLGKAMTIRGAVDGEGSPATIIDRESNGRIAKCLTGEGTDTAFVNLVFTGGYTASGDGGGLRCIGASPTVSNCSFVENTAVFGGGMYVESGSPVVLDCTFIGNVSLSDGGGMYAYLSSSPTLVNCVFENNTAVDDAGGLFNRTDTTSTLIDCTFEGNEASDVGGAIRNSLSTPTLTGCLLQGNIAGGVGGGGMWNSNSLPVLTNTIVCGNTPEQIHGEWTDAGGNVVEDACDEPPACPLDFNGDGVINGVDFGLFLAEWGVCEGCVGDLNKDGVVNGIDLGLFLVEWGLCP